MILLKRSVLSAILVSAVVLSGAKSSAAVDEKYFQIDKVEIKEVVQPSLMLRTEALCDSSVKPDLKGGPIRPNFDGINLDQIINLGQKIWTIVEKNQPVVNLKVQRAEAMPAGINSWMDLECWQVPESRIYRAVYKNFYGMTVVNLAFRVNYTYGGRLYGQGRYLSQVTVLPAELDVAWGFKLDGEVRVANITNAGTKDFPVGGIQLDVNWVIKTPIKYSESTETFYVRGDGLFKQIQ
jgi:hypothetical protein